MSMVSISNLFSCLSNRKMPIMRTWGVSKNLYWLQSSLFGKVRESPNWLVATNQPYYEWHKDERNFKDWYVRNINNLLALDIFICSFHKCIQDTTRGQSRFPLSKLWWTLLHIYCTKVLVVKLYSNQISKKGFKKGTKGHMRDLEGSLFLLFLAKAQSLSLGQALCLGQACQPPGHHKSLRKTPLCWMHSKSHCWDQGQGLAGTNRVTSTFTITFILMPSTFMMKYERHFFDGNTKEIYQSLKLVSVHYRNKAWIKDIGVHSF